MQDINRYISGLLFIHDCVILPGFGGFVTNNKDASHNELSSTFYPPKKDILFNKNLTYNDGLLINYLAKNLKITYTEAKKRVKDEVQKAWLELDKNGSVIFEGVGTFEYDAERKIIFSPDDSENFSTDSYGLSSFRFPTLSYQKNARDIIPLYNYTSNMNESVKKTIKWSVAAIAITIFGLAALIPFQKSNLGNQVAGYSFDTANDKPIEIVHTAMPVDTNMAEVINQNVDKRLALFYSEKTHPSVKKQNTKGYTFYIIGASYKDEANAQEHADIFIKKGFNATVLNVNELYRVSLYSFDNKVSALHELRRIRNEEDNDKVWLFSQK